MTIGRAPSSMHMFGLQSASGPVMQKPQQQKVFSVGHMVYTHEARLLKATPTPSSSSSSTPPLGDVTAGNRSAAQSTAGACEHRTALRRGLHPRTLDVGLAGRRMRRARRRRRPRRVTTALHLHDKWQLWLVRIRGCLVFPCSCSRVPLFHKVCVFHTTHHRVVARRVQYIE